MMGNQNIEGNDLNKSKTPSGESFGHDRFGIAGSVPAGHYPTKDLI